MNISILIVAVVIFLLVIHHNFLSLSDFLRRELSGMLGFILIKKKLFGGKTHALADRTLCVVWVNGRGKLMRL